ncbi:amidohydrolase family protein [soil metagenome]
MLYSANVVLPMTGPPLDDGGVLVTGDEIVAVGDATVLRRDADREQHIDGVVLPGLVNAHTHLELADAAQLAQPGPQHHWQQAVDGLTDGWEPARWQHSARRGVLHALRWGTTCVGDVVHRGPGVPAASRAGLAGDSWVRIADVDVREHDAVLSALRHTLGLPAPGRRLGICVESTARVATGTLQALAEVGRQLGAPLHAHAAVDQAEVRAIWHGDGPLAQQATQAGAQYEWLGQGTGFGPVRYLAECGFVRPGNSIAHGVWVDDAEARMLGAQRTALVVCPRSDARLQAGEPVLERYARAGVALALGTESLAAVEDQDLLAEAAAWTALARSQEIALWPGAGGPVELEEQAVRLITCDGAAAMCWASHSGVLTPGRRADLVGVDVATTSATAYRDLMHHGVGRQVLTVLAGVRRSRRADGDTAWPELDDAVDRAADRGGHDAGGHDRGGHDAGGPDHGGPARA